MGLVELLHPDVVAELDRLSLVEGERDELAGEVAAARAEVERLTIHAGFLRERLVNTEKRIGLVDLAALALARRAALYDGVGWVKVTRDPVEGFSMRHVPGRGRS